MNTLLDLRTLLISLQENGVEYILIGGQSLALHGFPRATEDVDLVVPFDKENGKKLIKALAFLKFASELKSEWFTAEANADEIQNIRIHDDLVVDILFAANGQTYQSLLPHIKTISFDGMSIRTLDIDGLLKTKTDFREKDIIDRAVLFKIKSMSNNNS
ncbi:MAG: nucleotidyl transferase AbiEii/AbiGii toxin family protein [Gallionella sp.]|nr:nucleotidyl transferase AbiEii/AbiGii toxin family protein [Gallionella sp.]